MGGKLSALINRLFDYPIKRKPICFHRQEDFTSTGEPIPGIENVAKEPPTEYDKLVATFYSRLLAQRRHAKQMQEKNKRWSVQKILKKYPGWNEMTISNLHSLFLLFDNQKTGMLSYPDFCAVLESLGDSTPGDLRKQKFDNADIDSDGWITYDEFLALLYNFTPPDDEALAGVAKLCYEIAENVRFVSSLSVGEQLDCSINCFKTHKSEICTPPIPNLENTGKTENVETVYRYPTEDTVPTEKLIALRDSKDIKTCLDNPHVRKIMQSILEAEDPTEAIAQAMIEPIFVELADACLRVVEPPEKV